MQDATDVRLLVKQGGLSKGCAYIQFASDEAVERALQKDSTLWFERHIFVARSAPPGPGGGGRRGGRGRSGRHGRGDGQGVRGGRGHARGQGRGRGRGRGSPRGEAGSPGEGRQRGAGRGSGRRNGIGFSKPPDEDGQGAGRPRPKLAVAVYSSRDAAGQRAAESGDGKAKDNASFKEKLGL